MAEFRVVTVGWPPNLIDGLCADIAATSNVQFSHVAHPRHTARNWPGSVGRTEVHFLRESMHQDLPEADLELLAALEQEGMPTLHNMILGDRVVSRLDHSDALQYATFIAKRLLGIFAKVRPSVVIGGFDSLHGGLALAVARQCGVPWFALHFSVIPPGLACLCDRMSPAARVQLLERPRQELLALAETSLSRFENRGIQPHAYLAPPRSYLRAVTNLPTRLHSFFRTLRTGRDREFLRFTEVSTRYDVTAAIAQLWRSHRAHAASAVTGAVAVPPAGQYVLFGLHMQPESSIDVWAPFFSNQLWVIELLSRSIPASHKLLVKIHKSDISSHSHEMLDRMRSFPGVALVHPSADSRAFIEKADLVVAIQGTMGLEAALLGRPVIMLGDSPVTIFPSAARVGALDDLPALVRSQLTRTRPPREAIVDAYASYLAPFMPASLNDWRTRKSASEVAGFARLFDALKVHVDGANKLSARSAL